MKTVQDVVHQFYTAVGKQDYSAARRLLYDDLSFQGPLATFHEADSYSEALKKLSNVPESGGD